jgi:Tol biopolymer transport system component/tRNA A-37 threonylcarbamoyl transferase component Bud32
MPLPSGTRLGPYEIVVFIDAGGMGEVYRARDTKLHRDVALKILPEAFAADADRLARFKREAQVLASLNHPHIAQIYGFEDSAATHALVMELVEGPTLADQISRGPMALADALPIAKQIAEALEAAHEQGIIHRDLKPANIKVRADGAVKVLDFGLAKAMEPPGASSTDAMNSPTLSVRATQMGMILGTAAYMSPEQARGKMVDKRVDIWAFGCVLFEMLTGRRAFRGEDVADTLANVLKAEPDWTALPATTPVPIRTLLRRCLEKDRRRRLDSAAAARLEIEDAQVPHARDAAQDGSKLFPWIVAGAAVLAASVFAALFFAARSRSVIPVGIARVDLNLPQGLELGTGTGCGVAISRDGTKVAFLGVDGGPRHIYVRPLDKSETIKLPIPQVQAPMCLAFAPDGGRLAFTASAFGQLGTISIADRLVMPLVQRGVNAADGVTWGIDGNITYVSKNALWQIPSTGGPPTQLTTLDGTKGELKHMLPVAVGDGSQVLFTVLTGRDRNAAHIEALTLRTGQRKVIVDRAKAPLLTSTGHLLFFRDDSIVAVRFDADRQKVDGQFVGVIDDVVVDSAGRPYLAISETGTLVYASRLTATSQLVWTSRIGLEEVAMPEFGMFRSPRVVPSDGGQVLVELDGKLRVKNLATTTFNALTSTSGYGYPTLTPDGTRVVFRTDTGLAWMPTDGSGSAQPIAGTSSYDYPNSVDIDNSTLAFQRFTDNTDADIYTLSLDGDSNVQPIIHEKYYEGGPQFSPNGKWLAYVSDTNERFQIYVRPFPFSNGKITLVSVNGGTQPRWNPNGKEIFYRDGDKMMAVSIRSESPDLQLSAPTKLFERKYDFTSVTYPNYDVSRDGRFLMVKPRSDSGQLTLVFNWTDELKRLVPAK